MTDNEKRLFTRVKQYFGNEIDWKDNTNVTSARRTTIYPDLVGKDSDGLHVIVEVKNAPSNISRDPTTAWRDTQHKSVGQILDYATAYMEQYNVQLKDMRMLIIGDCYFETVDKICTFLRDHVSL